MVPVVDLSRRGRDLAGAFAERVQALTAAGTYLLGDETLSFESELATWATGSAGAVAVSSGAAAVQLALAAIDVGPGDEVIIPAFTAVPTASAVCALGAIPVPIDVEPDTANLDSAAVAAAITDRTRAVVVVHLYGRPARIPLTQLPVIEDAAQAHGAVLDHSRSAAIAYSFYPTKNLGGIGDGGAVVSADTRLLDRVRHLRTHGMTAQYVHESISQNFRISELEAAWLRIGLPSLAVRNARRRAIAAHYRATAPQLRWTEPHPDHVHHLCVVRSPHRDDLRAELAAREVATAIHYPLAVTQQPGYRHFARHACPEAERWASECVSLPCFPELSDVEVEVVASALSTLGARHGGPT